MRSSAVQELRMASTCSINFEGRVFLPSLKDSDMKQYISEDRKIYEDMYHGQFSKKLAKWAIENMKTKDIQSGKEKPIEARSLEEVQSIIKEFNIELEDKYKYTAWYLFNMAIADYRVSLPNDEVRACFVWETIKDPDGCPANVLDCFVTKMCNAGEIICWDEML